MNPGLTDRATWTDEQEAVLALAPDARALVVAAAGTGKTAVLIERLSRLINEESLAAGSEILVVSFTRAAVGEIRRRLAEAAGGSRTATVMTFDSFASRILAAVDPGGTWMEAGYEGRIEAAIALIRDSAEAKAIMSGIRHILVDEIQDLVCPRSVFIATLLNELKGGFTAFGDPAQAIFDYQAAPQAIDIFEAIRMRFRPMLDELPLSLNHRAQTEATKAVIEIGAPLSGGDPDYQAIRVELVAFAKSLPSLGGASQAAGQLKRASRPTAILTRNNGQALLVSRALRDLSVPHSLRRRAVDRAIAPWLARTVLGMDRAQTSRRALAQQYEDLVGERGPSFDEAWMQLRRFNPGGPQAADLDLIHRRIVAGRVPDDLTPSQTEIVTVSTVHRSKGLEFDTVVIVDPGASLDLRRPEALPEETRVLYVALTRAQRYLFRFESGHRPLRKDDSTDRWIKPGPQAWQTFGIEIGGDDMDPAFPAGAHLLPDEDASDIQNYLWESVKVGHPIELKLLRASIAGPPTAIYAASHNGKTVAITGQQFGEHLGRRLGNSRAPRRWPKRITDLHVEGIDTVAGPRAYGQNAGIGGTGLWLRLRAVGLGEFDWS